MTDEERDRIRKESREGAQLENRIFNLEEEVKEMKALTAWFFRAMWGGAAYLAMQVYTFIAGGGIIK